MNTHEESLSFSVTVTRSDGRWSVAEFADNFKTISTSVAAVRKLRSEGAAFAVLCVEDEYFVIVRPSPARVEVFLSDMTMAVDDEFAASAAAEFDGEIPDLDPDELDSVDPWPEGDFDILSDLGLSEQVLSVICDDDSWPHEQIMRIAEEVGFDDELAQIIGLD